MGCIAAIKTFSGRCYGQTLETGNFTNGLYRASTLPKEYDQRVAWASCRDQLTGLRLTKTVEARLKVLTHYAVSHCSYQDALMVIAMPFQESELQVVSTKVIFVATAYGNTIPT
jgi:hypothetical protein